MDISETKTQPKKPSRRRAGWLLGATLVLAIGILAAYQVLPSQKAAIVSTGGEASANHQLTLPIMIDTAGQTVNAAEIYLTFDPKMVKVTKVSKDKSFFTLWVTDQPAYSNAKGEISFAGGVVTPGFKGKGQIGSVTLQSKRAVTTKLVFGTKTQALLNDGKGTAIPLTLEPIKVVIR